MAAVVVSNCPVGPQFLTRAWVLTPSYLNHRADKSSREKTPFAYRILTDIPRQNVRRSLDPYKVGRTMLRWAPGSKRAFHAAPNVASIASPSAAASSIPHISLHIAAASSGKGRRYNPESSTFDFVPSNTDALGLQKEGTIYQKRRARPDSGQDAYFVSRVGKDSHITAFGVADGVGGWSDHGVDPADFSHGLCSYMAEAALHWQADKADGEAKLGPRQLLDIGYDGILKDPQIRAGGSTACIAVADEDGRMRVANLGDSGFLQLRLGKVHHYSNPQTHAFNTPYQMSITPPEILTQAAIFGGLPFNDMPARADVADHMLRHGDVLVLATDGVWDNLSSQDILHIASKKMRESEAWTRTNDKGYTVTDKLASLVTRSTTEKNQQATLQSLIASAIVGEAKTASMDRKRDGPFAKAAQREYPTDMWHGGKIDDITVLVVIPIENGKDGEGETPIKAKL